jgi:hypothetical protein
VRDVEFAGEARVGEGEFLADALEGGIDSKAGFDADDQEIEGVGEAPMESFLMIADTELEPEGWEGVGEEAAQGEAEPKAVEDGAGKVSGEDAGEEAPESAAG